MPNKETSKKVTFTIEARREPGKPETISEFGWHLCCPFELVGEFLEDKDLIKRIIKVACELTDNMARRGVLSPPNDVWVIELHPKDGVSVPTKKGRKQ